MKIICWFRGIWLSLMNWPDYPISGCEGQEYPDGKISCSTCGEVMYDPAALEEDKR
jgi:hypothetical protein